MKNDFKSFRKRIIGHQPKRKAKGNPPNCTSSVVTPIKISDDIFKRVLGISLRAHEIQTLERYYAIRASIEKDMFEIMDYDEIKKFKERESKQDGFNIEISIIDELHSINDKEREDEYI